MFKAELQVGECNTWHVPSAYSAVFTVALFTRLLYFKVNFYHEYPSRKNLSAFQESAAWGEHSKASPSITIFINPIKQQSGIFPALAEDNGKMSSDATGKGWPLFFCVPHSDTEAINYRVGSNRSPLSGSSKLPFNLFKLALGLTTVQFLPPKHVPQLSETCFFLVSSVSNTTFTWLCINAYEVHERKYCHVKKQVQAAHSKSKLTNVTDVANKAV